VTPPPFVGARVLALSARGYTDLHVAAVVGCSLSTVRRLRLRAQVDAARAAPRPTARELALERGRVLAQAKVARGEWVRPAAAAGGAR